MNDTSGKWEEHFGGTLYHRKYKHKGDFVASIRHLPAPGRRAPWRVSVYRDGDLSARFWCRRPESAAYKATWIVTELVMMLGRLETIAQVGELWPE